MLGLGVFFHLGCCKITLPCQVSELWLLGNESWSQLTRLSMAGLKILHWDTPLNFRCQKWVSYALGQIQAMSGGHLLLFLMDRDKKSSTSILSHNLWSHISAPQRMHRNRSIHWSVDFWSNRCIFWFITILKVSQSPIYGQWRSSKLWIWVVLQNNILAVWLCKLLGYLLKLPTEPWHTVYKYFKMSAISLSMPPVYSPLI